MALWHGDELAAQPTSTATAALVRASTSPPVGRENGWREQSRPAAGVLSRRLAEIFDHLECGVSAGVSGASGALKGRREARASLPPEHFWRATAGPIPAEAISLGKGREEIGACRRSWRFRRRPADGATEQVARVTRVRASLMETVFSSLGSTYALA
jgi:hypothetical protein